MKLSFPNVNQAVGVQGPHTVEGWVHALRKHGKLVFCDLRDSDWNLLQCVSREGLFNGLNPEDVVAFQGEVKQRPANMVNPEIITGTVELVVEKVEILNKATFLPIPVDTDGKEIAEDKRLRYRYLDLRRKRLHENLRKRAEVMWTVRNALENFGFLEIETPILTKSTKEGARDFVVPSRWFKGSYYALPQSPQQYKQLLMAAGFDRYYQIARCFRDETPRADRGFEFTQLDLEMAFVTEHDVLEVIESVVMDVLGNSVGYADDIKIRETVLGRLYFPVLTYAEAMEKHGTDKPDLRSQDDKDKGLLRFCWIVRFPMFKPVKEADDKLDTKSAWTFMHNPFSAPIPEHTDWHLNGQNVGDITAQQYDLVCNGMEIGSGSIRAHRRDLLTATFKVMGYTHAEIEASVGHMLEAFDSGTPPHGGIALGIDRLVMLVAGEESMKEVIPFPTSGTGRTAVMDAPSPLTPEQRKELGL